MREESGALILMVQKFGIPEWISPLRLLQELDIKPDQAADILISHAHFDHMGAIDKYPKATFICKRRNC
jgi:glyoxylase-like metal-dependent hydrolase (beta-lactamase superfamily II)